MEQQGPHLHRFRTTLAPPFYPASLSSSLPPPALPSRPPKSLLRHLPPLSLSSPPTPTASHFPFPPPSSSNPYPMSKLSSAIDLESNDQFHARPAARWLQDDEHDAPWEATPKPSDYQQATFASDLAVGGVGGGGGPATASSSPRRSLLVKSTRSDRLSFFSTSSAPPTPSHSDENIYRHSLPTFDSFVPHLNDMEVRDDSEHCRRVEGGRERETSTQNALGLGLWLEGCGKQQMRARSFSQNESEWGDAGGRSSSPHPTTDVFTPFNLNSPDSEFTFFPRFSSPSKSSTQATSRSSFPEQLLSPRRSSPSTSHSPPGCFPTTPPDTPSSYSHNSPQNNLGVYPSAYQHQPHPFSHHYYTPPRTTNHSPAPHPLPAILYPPSPPSPPVPPQTRMYPLSPSDTSVIASLHNGRIPTFDQLAPPDMFVSSQSNVQPAIVNTGNQGPMIVQAGDWKCGSCSFVNWRRRRICLRCFPFAHEIGQALVVGSQRAKMLASSPLVTIAAPAPPSPPPREPLAPILWGNNAFTQLENEEQQHEGQTRRFDGETVTRNEMDLWRQRLAEGRKENGSRSSSGTREKSILFV